MRPGWLPRKSRTGICSPCSTVGFGLRARRKLPPAVGLPGVALGVALLEEGQDLLLGRIPVAEVVSDSEGRLHEVVLELLHLRRSIIRRRLGLCDAAGASVAGDDGAALGDPGPNASVQALDLEAFAGQFLRRLGAAGAAQAHRHHRPNGVELTDALVEVVERDVHRTVDVARLPLVRVAHVDDSEPVRPSRQGGGVHQDRPHGRLDWTGWGASWSGW